MTCFVFNHAHWLLSVTQKKEDTQLLSHKTEIYINTYITKPPISYNNISSNKLSNILYTRRQMLVNKHFKVNKGLFVDTKYHTNIKPTTKRRPFFNNSINIRICVLNFVDPTCEKISYNISIIIVRTLCNIIQQINLKSSFFQFLSY